MHTTTVLVFKNQSQFNYTNITMMMLISKNQYYVYVLIILKSETLKIF